MSGINVAVKTCRKCHETKPLSQFSRNRSSADGHHGWCVDCSRAQALKWKQDERERIGEEAFLARQRRIVDEYRRRTGDEVGRRYVRARSAATRALIAAHRAEFDHLLLLARRGELPQPSAERSPS